LFLRIGKAPRQRVLTGAQQGEPELAEGPGDCAAEGVGSWEGVSLVGGRIALEQSRERAIEDQLVDLQGSYVRELAGAGAGHGDESVRRVDERSGIFEL
jgi:hypothetical protein